MMNTGYKKMFRIITGIFLVLALSSCVLTRRAAGNNSQAVNLGGIFVTGPSSLGTVPLRIGEAPFPEGYFRGEEVRAGELRLFPLVNLVMYGEDSEKREVGSKGFEPDIRVKIEQSLVNQYIGSVGENAGLYYFSGGEWKPLSGPEGGAGKIKTGGGFIRFRVDAWPSDGRMIALGGILP